MANLIIIKELIRKNNFTIREFAGEIGMTEQGLQKLIRENSTKVETLELIANKLNVSVSVFFNDSISTIQAGSSKEDRLLAIIESQQDTIKELSKKI